MQASTKSGSGMDAVREERRSEDPSLEASRDFEKLGENAASIVRGTFSVVNDLMEELNEESRLRSAPEEGEDVGRFRALSARYPVAVAMAAGFAGLLTGAFAAGAIGYTLSENRRSPNEQLRRFSRAVPRLVNRWAKKVA